ncbi:hypothetical protein SOVF_001050 [Spinacia oleracea]|uniref:Ferredoxin n=1 Tax=Spinacia oleracea TaxID=3562 RepID=A0A9R0JNH6_SPIOL|nr:ferredoxin C 1, chloroplastic [Spinacia oleracea]KNA26038.1 hypothetical protein SOVF_001050 [Spinacia oleracea]
MASLNFTTPSTLLTLPKQTQQPKLITKHHHQPFYPLPPPPQPPSRLICNGYKVVVEHDGVSTVLDVDPDETILSKALDAGLDTPNDCKLGVCMTCPAKLISGKVDQSEGMLSDDVVESGYALLCVAYPRSDCSIRTIPEEELLSLQLATAND